MSLVPFLPARRYTLVLYRNGAQHRFPSIKKYAYLTLELCP